MEQELAVSLCRSQLSVAHLGPADLNLDASLFLDASVLYYLHDPSAVLCYLSHKGKTKQEHWSISEDTGTTLLPSMPCCEQPSRAG